MNGRATHRFLGTLALGAALLSATSLSGLAAGRHRPGGRTRRQRRARATSTRSCKEAGATDTPAAPADAAAPRRCGGDRAAERWRSPTEAAAPAEAAAARPRPAAEPSRR